MTPAPDNDKYSKFSCPNPECPCFNQLGQNNIAHRSWTGKDKNIQRLRCKICKKEFSQREGTLMAKTKLPQETIMLLLKCQRWGVCDNGSADICEVDIKTVHRFQKVAAIRAKEHHEQVVKDLKVDGVQMDEMHSKLRPKRVEWLHTAIAMKSLFLLWVHFGERSQPSAIQLIANVVARLKLKLKLSDSDRLKLKELPIFFSDGWKAYLPALLQVLGKVYRPKRKGKVGRKPKARLVAPKELFYAQIVKLKNAKGRLIEVVPKVVFGGGGKSRFFKQLKAKKLGNSINNINTAFMERFYATLRGLVAPLRRRTRCLSWVINRHRGRVWLIVDLYNFVLPHKSLRSGSSGHRLSTPAMAIGLAKHVWSYHDYIWHPVHPDKELKRWMTQRVAELIKPALEPS
jgi:transposase-like protein